MTVEDSSTTIIYNNHNSDNNSAMNTNTTNDTDAAPDTATTPAATSFAITENYESNGNVAAQSPVATGASVPSSTAMLNNTVKHKRRFCRAEGCTRIVKSQGLCQRHGAKPRNCKVPGCAKQAQGNFDGMCKSHFKAHKRTVAPLPAAQPIPSKGAPPPTPVGNSVYDFIIPASLRWNANMGNNANNDTKGATTVTSMMPLIQHLKAGFDNPHKPSAWHRNEERAARGLPLISNPATQLETWERELVWTEILLLTGTADASFRHLARAWGRDKGFHMVLCNFICKRRGDVERKKRKLTDTENASNNKKKRTTRNSNKSNVVEENNASNAAVSANVWDTACYNTTSYNEELAANLMELDDDENNTDEYYSFEDMASTDSTDTVESGIAVQKHATTEQAVLEQLEEEEAAHKQALEASTEV